MARRSIVLEGVTTSIYLEDVFWEEIERRASEKGMRWYHYIRSLLEGADQPPNRSAALREALVRDLRADLQVGAGRAKSRWWVCDPNAERIVSTYCQCVRVGRSLDNDIALDDVDVSRKHLLLAHDGDAWWAVDLGSRNGIWVKRKRITARKLRANEVVHCGTSRIGWIY